MNKKSEISGNYEGDGFVEIFPHQPIGLPWPEEIKNRKDIIAEAVKLVGESMGKQVPDTSITEVSDVLSEELDIKIGHLDQGKGYPNRTLRINGFLYEAKEEVEIGGGVVAHIKPIFEDSESFELPDEIQYADSADDTIRTLQSGVKMQNSKAGSIKRIRVSDFHGLRAGIQKMFLDLNELAIGQTAESISNNWSLRRNYGFMTWYIRNYNKSLETAS